MAGTLRVDGKVVIARPNTPPPYYQYPSSAISHQYDKMVEDHYPDPEKMTAILAMMITDKRHETANLQHLRIEIAQKFIKGSADLFKLFQERFGNVSVESVFDPSHRGWNRHDWNPSYAVDSSRPDVASRNKPPVWTSLQFPHFSLTTMQRFLDPGSHLSPREQALRAYISTLCAIRIVDRPALLCTITQPDFRRDDGIMHLMKVKEYDPLSPSEILESIVLWGGEYPPYLQFHGNTCIYLLKLAELLKQQWTNEVWRFRNFAQDGVVLVLDDNPMGSDPATAIYAQILNRITAYIFKDMPKEYRNYYKLLAVSNRGDPKNLAFFRTVLPKTCRIVEKSEIFADPKDIRTYLSKETSDDLRRLCDGLTLVLHVDPDPKIFAQEVAPGGRLHCTDAMASLGVNRPDALCAFRAPHNVCKFRDELRKFDVDGLKPPAHQHIQSL